MSPASRSAAKAATPSPSWAFSESFVPDDDTMRLARAASRQLALTPASQGVTSALTFFARLISARAVVEIGTGWGSLAMCAAGRFGGVRRAGRPAR